MHWTLIECGSNQKYIFATNKQRLQVAASALIWQLGYEWIAEAITSVGAESVAVEDISAGLGANQVCHVVRASGKAILLVGDRDTGRRIAEAVTTRALIGTDQAPGDSGIDAWGCTGPPVAADLADASDRLFETEIELTALRSQRIPVSHRSPLLPFHQPCAYTSRPAITWQPETSQEKDTYAMSAVIDHQFHAASGARRRMVSRLKSDDPALVRRVVGLQDLGDGVTDNGWIAVLHADGNGIGQIFTNLGLAYQGAEFIDRQHRLSSVLEDVTWAALRATLLGEDAATGKPDPDLTKAFDAGGDENTVLPIVVGGDDISVVLSAHMAFPFAVLLTRNFGHYADIADFRDALEDVARVLPDTADIPDRVTLAAGMVFTKPHHPFTHAIDVAEALTSMAKRRSGRRAPSVAVHMLYESAVQELSALRRAAGFEVGNAGERYCYLADAWLVEGSGAGTVERVNALLAELAPADADERTVRDDGTAGLTRSNIALLRDAVTEPDSDTRMTEAIRAALTRLEYLGRRVPQAVAAELDELLDRPDDGSVGAAGFSTALVSALELIDVSRGTEYARSGERAEASR